MEGDTYSGHSRPLTMVRDRSQSYASARPRSPPFALARVGFWFLAVEMAGLALEMSDLLSVFGIVVPRSFFVSAMSIFGLAIRFLYPRCACLVPWSVFASAISILGSAIRFCLRDELVFCFRDPLFVSTMIIRFAHTRFAQISSRTRHISHTARFAQHSSRTTDRFAQI